MLNYLKHKWNEWFKGQSHEDMFDGKKTAVDAFTDPSVISPQLALTLIDTAVANRPDADQLREALAIRFIKERGINMHGTTIHDEITNEKSDPDLNPDTLYVSPYARPTAGSTIMPAYHDSKGEIYIALVKNWVDPKNHGKGVRDEWSFPGGYLNARDAHTRKPQQYDQNLDATAKRELREEINITLGAQSNPEQLFIRSDSGAEHNTPTHSIDAYYLVDLGRSDSPPPMKAGDDVAMAQWVNIRNFERHAGPTPDSGIYHCDVNNSHDTFLPAHCELLERGIAALRAKIFPLQNDANFTSQVDKDTFAHYDRVAQAHGFGEHKPTAPASPWQDRMAVAPETPSLAIH